MSRLSYLLGEMRRQKNGAVADGMRFYGAEYGLNYGVSLPTVRSIARAEIERDGVDHRFAEQLYRQEVRELRLAALWMADSSVVGSQLEFWARGIVNSEIAEEAAFALFYRVVEVEAWLTSEDELLRYCALMSISKRGAAAEYIDRVPSLLSGEVHILPQAVVTLLESALRSGVERAKVQNVVDQIVSANIGGAKHIAEEMAWRVEL